MDIATWIIALGTVALVGVTAWYAKLTHAISEAAGDSAQAARRSAEHAERAANTAERSASLVAEQHHDDQLRRFEVSFDTNTQMLLLRNTSTTAEWDRVAISVVNYSEGPIAALDDPPDAPVDDAPPDVGIAQSPLHFINLGRVKPTDVRLIPIERSSKHAKGVAVIRLTCWRNDGYSPVLLECEIPPRPPIAAAAWV